MGVTMRKHDTRKARGGARISRPIVEKITTPVKEKEVTQADREFGERIRSRREELGMAREAVAEALGVTASAVQQWENGYVSPRADRISPLSKLLGIQYDYMFEGDDSRLRTTHTMEEQMLLRIFRTLDIGGRQALIAIAARMEATNSRPRED